MISSKTFHQCGDFKDFGVCKPVTRMCASVCVCMCTCASVCECAHICACVDNFPSSDSWNLHCDEYLLNTNERIRIWEPQRGVQSEAITRKFKA